MPVLVLVEHDNKAISDATFNAIGAAQQINESVHLLVLGHHCDDVVISACAVQGVEQVLVLQDQTLENPASEHLAAIICAQSADYSHILAASSALGKSTMPRVAAQLDVAQLSDISAVLAPDTFERPIYAGNVLTTVKSHESKQVITVLSTKFAPVAATGGDAKATNITMTEKPAAAEFVARASVDSEGPQLSNARIVVSGGRGVGSEENFQLIEGLAKKLGGAVGASRAAVDAGYAANDCQIGQTGKMVAPDLYIAVGISGAIQHLAGMKDSKTIVAINQDPDAPIFSIADVGIVGDLFDVLPALESSLN
ncbi:MAG: electron transfer flavoprotein subunit alpha/FixB family protein [Pseudomonadota bacterium]|nr:electron transfer flavoprotein subunit alpha/FixB family protein [Pseudomonadota bacterium]